MAKGVDFPPNPRHTELVHFTELMNKAELIDAYAQQVLDSMDMKTLEQYAYDMLVDCFKGYTEDELITEISETYPELLEE